MNVHLMGFIGLLLVNMSSILGSTKYEDEYWGSDEQPCSIDESIRPFKIFFDKEMIDDLKMRLNNTRKSQPSMKNVDWSYGTNSDFIPTVVDYWLNKYDFKKREAHLNQYPQFLTNIQGVGISDSPTGLASYILEKFALSSRTEKLGFGNETTLLEKYTMDELLDNLMLYWAPNKVPSACTQFPFELINLPKRLLRERFVNMVSFTKLPRDGHFVAMEEPRLLADDVWAAVKKMRKHYNLKHAAS